LVEVNITGAYVSLILLPTVEIISAPKDFSVWRLNSLDDEGHYHGELSYDKNGNPTQYFTIQEAAAYPFHSTELKIQTNHSNPRYLGLIASECMEHHGQASALSN
jgi:hypothetical protein